MAESRFFHTPFQNSEYFIDIRNNLRIRSQQRHIRIDLSRLLIEITGTQIGEITPFKSLGRILPKNDRNLRMYFQARNTINDTNTGLLHTLCRTHIILLVETGFQFHKYRHFLTILGSADQRINHGRILCHSILGNLDLIHLRIKGRLHQKADQIIKRLIREMQ